MILMNMHTISYNVLRKWIKAHLALHCIQKKSGSSPFLPHLTLLLAYYCFFLPLYKIRWIFRVASVLLFSWVREREIGSMPNLFGDEELTSMQITKCVYKNILVEMLVGRNIGLEYVLRVPFRVNIKMPVWLYKCT